jgi:hypothetical protein
MIACSPPCNRSTAWTTHHSDLYPTLKERYKAPVHLYLIHLSTKMHPQWDKCQKWKSTCLKKISSKKMLGVRSRRKVADLFFWAWMLGEATPVFFEQRGPPCHFFKKSLFFNFPFSRSNSQPTLKLHSQRMESIPVASFSLTVTPPRFSYLRVNIRSKRFWPIPHLETALQPEPRNPETSMIPSKKATRLLYPFT